MIPRPGNGVMARQARKSQIDVEGDHIQKVG